MEVIDQEPHCQQLIIIISYSAWHLEQVVCNQASEREMLPSEARCLAYNQLSKLDLFFAALSATLLRDQDHRLVTLHEVTAFRLPACNCMHTQQQLLNPQKRLRGCTDSAQMLCEEAGKLAIIVCTDINSKTLEPLARL